MLWPKKNSHKEFDNEKNSCGSQISLPPHNFSNDPSLTSHMGGVLCRKLLSVIFDYYRISISAIESVKSSISETRKLKIS